MTWDINRIKNLQSHSHPQPYVKEPRLLLITNYMNKNQIHM